MSKLDELLEETNFTPEEYHIYIKIQRHYQLEDLKDTINLNIDYYTEKEIEEIEKNADIIIEKYDKWLEYDWERTMRDAINWVIKQHLEV